MDTKTRESQNIFWMVNPHDVTSQTIRITRIRCALRGDRNRVRGIHIVFVATIGVVADNVATAAATRAIRISRRIT